MEYAINVTNKRIYPHRSLETEACKHDGVRVLCGSVFGVEIVREEKELENLTEEVNGAIKDADCQKKKKYIYSLPG